VHLVLNLEACLSRYISRASVLPCLFSFALTDLLHVILTQHISLETELTLSSVRRIQSNNSGGLVLASCRSHSYGHNYKKNYIGLSSLENVQIHRY